MSRQVAILALLWTYGALAEAPPEGYLLGLRLMQERLYADAARQFERVHNEQAAGEYGARALFMAAECKKSAGWRDAAVECYRQLADSKDLVGLLARLRLAEAALDDGEAGRALELLSRIRGLSGEQEGFRVYLEARALAAAGRTEEAEKLLLRVSDAPVVGDAAALLLGWLYEMAGRTADAQAQYLAVVNRTGGHGAYRSIALVHLADVARRAGRYEEALGLVRRAGQPLPRPEEFLASLVEGACMLALGQSSEQAALALNRAAAALKRLPETAAAGLAPGLRLLEAAAALASGKPQVLRSALAGVPADSEHALWLRAWLAYIERDYKAALATARGAASKVQAAPLREDMRLVTAAAALALGDWQAALDAADRPFSGRPVGLDAVITAAAALRLKRHDTAIEALRQVSAKAPTAEFVGWAKAAELLAEAAAGADVTSERISAVIAEKDTAPYQPLLRRLLVASALAAGNLPAVEQACRELLPEAKDAEASNLRLLLAWALYSQGKRIEAADALLAVPDDIGSKHQAALVLAEAGAHDRARPLLAEAARAGLELAADTALYAAQAAEMPADDVLRLLRPMLEGRHGDKYLELSLRRLLAAAWQQNNWKLLAAGAELALKAATDDPAKALARLYRALAALKAGDFNTAAVASQNALPGLGGADRILGLYVCGMAALKTGEREEALAHLLYVGILTTPGDAATGAMRKEALAAAAETAKNMDRLEVAELASRYLRQ